MISNTPYMCRYDPSSRVGPSTTFSRARFFGVKLERGSKHELILTMMARLCGNMVCNTILAHRCKLLFPRLGRRWVYVLMSRERSFTSTELWNPARAMHTIAMSHPRSPSRCLHTTRSSNLTVRGRFPPTRTLPEQMRRMLMKRAEIALSPGFE